MLGANSDVKKITVWANILGQKKQMWGLPALPHPMLLRILSADS